MKKITASAINAGIESRPYPDTISFHVEIGSVSTLTRSRRFVIVFPDFNSASKPSVLIISFLNSQSVQ